MIQRFCLSPSRSINGSALICLPGTVAAMPGTLFNSHKDIRLILSLSLPSNNGVRTDLILIFMRNKIKTILCFSI
jgi:hypothetical protein